MNAIKEELLARLAEFVSEKKTGKITLEVNISQGGIGQTFIDVREALQIKR